MEAFDLLAHLVAALASAPCLYLGLLAVAALRAPRRPGGDAGRAADGHLIFVVPAHDEEADILATLEGLAEVADGDCAIHVIADNCSDATAELARGQASGAGVPVHVWERSDPERKAKGFALQWGLPRIFASTHGAGRPARFVCIVDADVRLSPGSVARARRAFSAGHEVLQSPYLFDPGLGLRAEIMRLAAAAMVTRSLGRAALGLSDTLKGTGMWFRRELLDRMPWHSHSLAEDLEHTFELVNAGVPVHALAGTQVTGKLAASRAGETEQRLRWEGGRWAVVRQQVPVLLGKLVRRPDRQTLDLLLELVVPPLGLLVGLQACVLAGVLVLHPPAAVTLLIGWGLLGVYVLVGVRLSGMPWRSLAALIYVPPYVLWKLLLLPRTLIASRSKRWVRTAR